MQGPTSYPVVQQSPIESKQRTLYTAFVHPVADPGKTAELFCYTRGWAYQCGQLMNETDSIERLSDKSGSYRKMALNTSNFIARMLKGITDDCSYENTSNLVLFGAWDQAGRLHGLALVDGPPRDSKVSMRPTPFTTAKIIFMFAAIQRLSKKAPQPPKGTGTALVRHIKEWAKENRCISILLETVPTAIEFYKKIGFKEQTWRVQTEGSSAWMELPASGTKIAFRSRGISHRMVDTLQLPPIAHPVQIWNQVGDPSWARMQAICTEPNQLFYTVISLPFFAPGLQIDENGQTVAHFLSLNASRTCLLEPFLRLAKVDDLNKIWNAPQEVGGRPMTVLGCLYLNRAVNRAPQIKSKLETRGAKKVRFVQTHSEAHRPAKRQRTEDTQTTSSTMTKTPVSEKRPEKGKGKAEAHAPALPQNQAQATHSKIDLHLTQEHVRQITLDLGKLPTLTRSLVILQAMLDTKMATLEPTT